MTLGSSFPTLAKIEAFSTNWQSIDVAVSPPPTIANLKSLSKNPSFLERLFAHRIIH
jgi:hypothetical protein